MNFNGLSILNFGLFIFLGVAVVIGCTKDKVDVAPDITKFEFVKPVNFPAPVYTFANNELTSDRFNLGRDLFYSKDLSSDGTISCASCHSQAHGFADQNSAFSEGVNGALGLRNTPTIVNMAWNSNFMWDGGVNHLDIFAFAPITNVLEMNETIPNLQLKLNASQTWKAKFKKAYNVEEITDQWIFRALGQYMAMIVSSTTKYDKVMSGDENFSTLEADGYALFQSNCTNCHAEPLLTDRSYRNNGLDNVFADLGRELITSNLNDRGKFKVPTLRNVALTYPYMHDGRFLTLQEVIDHYSEGVVTSSTLDSSLTAGIPLTSTQKSALIAFLNTLTDYSLMADSRFYEP